MKNIICPILLCFLLLFHGSLITVGAEPAVVGTRDGALGANGNWDDGYEKEAEGTGLKVFYSGNCYGYQFEDVPAGVYKIGHYFTITDSLEYGKMIRISPVVDNKSMRLQCWIDWHTAEAIAALSDALDADKGKILLVSVIQVPQDGSTIDAGFWQHTGAYIGTLDKVVLATAQYDFQDTEYVLVGEKSYNKGYVFNEDPEQKLLAPEDSWTVSSQRYEVSTAVPQVTQKPTDAHMVPQEQHTARTSASGQTGKKALVDIVQTGLLVAIIVVAVTGIAGVVLLSFWKGKQNKK